MSGEYAENAWKKIIIAESKEEAVEEGKKV